MSSFGIVEGLEKHVCNMTKRQGTSKKFVSRRMDEKGFTLIEALLSFSLFCIISLSIPLMMKGFSTIKHDLVPPRYYEWNLFHESVRSELRKANDVKVLPNQISFVIDGETILYEKYSQSIRRRVNNRGHEIVLQSVDQFTFDVIHQGVHLDLEFDSGEKVEGKFFYFAAVEGETSP
ncbi:competence type IV pilus minor pilin ComGF [Rossellomorea sp. SC111]|uniref:competence type IV pilus minor pilin ComGF n=1 Tax=Rossellomorea sp. SC111 TaxID=2968985 RepID=UPI0028110C6B|nr:competence type IV pilus minor pilin ComGF [Rossellomorea sp. SC111]MCR8847122.1 competence type IV pilus minor pilin ComGF [Rossellomorea sp. SC111]